ncbi:hypothetical protein [Streptomyces sp. UNOC14_S4]|uniref:hypothetical protein n=1 Tax=Streptomyces sp. UNOC14_S4 TaxID=2872340 RepID=UPI001E2C0EAF|nr:hypothetical protein [Streptomyces sp. UNOC14_S4]MCC3766852.1 hypothetical protein [Streptomyces sp. UNOC14_S4]
MNLALSRICAVAVLLLGIALSFWNVFGAPHDWEGSMKWLRLPLWLAVPGLISASAKLMFPSGTTDRAR